MQRNRPVTLSFPLILGLAVVFCGCNDDLPVSEQESKSDQKEAAEKVSGPQSKAVVEDGVYEFGTMEVGQKLSHEFVIRNDGEAPLTLKKDRSTCKCTVVSFDEAEVAPGDSIKIKLEWEGKVIDPAYSHAGYLKTNDPNNKEISIAVMGRVESSYAISPTGTWNLGEMNRGKPTEFNGSIMSRVLDNFEFVEATCSNEIVSIRLVPMDKKQLEENRAKTGYLIKGEVATGAPLGTFSEHVTLNFLVDDKEKGGKKKNEAFFSIEGFYSGPLQIVGPLGWNTSKMTMIFGRIQAKEGKVIRLSMFVRDNTDGPIEVKEVISKPDFLKFTLKKDESFQAKNRERYDMTIEIPPGSPPSQYYKENPALITVVTNNPVIGTMKILVQMISY